MSALGEKRLTIHPVEASLPHGASVGSLDFGGVRSTTTSIHFAQNAPGSLPISSVSTSSASLGSVSSR
jgi:hypothetical protein